jgi:eukaryotic-like serine/threonine-protein kinase
MEREGMLWGNALAQLIRAGAATLSERADDAVTLLNIAEAGLRSADMLLYAAAARRENGELMAGEKGRALTADADAWMAGQQIQNPERMAAMLAPGRWSKAEIGVPTTT